MKITPSQNASRVILRHVTEYHDSALALIGKGRRIMRLFCPDLEHDIYDADDIGAAVSALARVSRNSEIRILIRNTKPAIKRGHRLLDLSRRLPQLVEIRKFTLDTEELPSHVLLLDDFGVMVRTLDDAVDSGFASFDDRALNKSLAQIFDELWYRSQSDYDLRGVNI